MIPNPSVATARWHRGGILRLMEHPEHVWPLLNARWRLRGVGRLALSVRLIGRARICGGRRITLGERVLIFGTTVPVEIATLDEGQIAIGEGTFVNYGVSIAAHESITIGRDCQIGQYVIINDNDFHSVEDKRRLPPSKPVVLEDRVWLGARVIVQKGVRIGHDAVISAGSVVTHDIPPRTVAAGVPARVLRQF